MAVNTFVRFGPDSQLVGILAGPESGAPTTPVLLLPSAGLQPRSGPFRLHAELAAELAERGIRSFRFDLPGVGEAPRLNDCDGPGAALSAIAALTSEIGATDFVIGGICSAADVAWSAALTDERISAVLMLDGICFTGPWFHFARSIDRLRRLPREWKRMLRGAPARLKGEPSLGSADFREWPSHADARRQFAELVARGVRSLWIYSGGYTDRILHGRQFAWAFGPPARSAQVVMHYWPDCDHTYFSRAHRDRLLDTVASWMESVAFPVEKRR